MKRKIIVALAVVSLGFFSQRGLAAGTNDPAAELHDLVAQIKAKMQTGPTTEKDLAGELKAFDGLLAEHKGEKTDAVAQILMMKATLYLQVLDDHDKGIESLKQLKRDFPDTQAGRNVDKVLEMAQMQADAKKIQASLVKGMKFPGFIEKDVTGKPLSPDDYKGRVVLVDFWATWCAPCVRELPNVIATYEKHHGQGLEIIGVSLDRNEASLVDFIKEKKISWRQIFDTDGKIAVKCGVVSIPATFLLDGGGNILGQSLRGEALKEAVISALAKK